MALGPADVYSTAAPGLAQVLSGRNPVLDVYRQEAYRQQAAEARRLKAQQDLERSLTVPTLDVNGSQYFQDEVNQSAKDAAAKFSELSRAAVDRKITRADYLIGAAAEKARHDAVAKRATDAGAALDKFKAEARANNLDMGKLGLAVGSVIDDPETGQRISVNKFDAGRLAALNTNPDYINEAAAIDDFLDKAQLSHKAEYTQAARPGVPGMQYSMQSLRLPFADNGRGQPLMIRRADGRMVPKIDNIEFIDQLANAHPQVGAILRHQYEQGLQANAARLINGEAALPVKNQQQTTADLLRGYGSLSTQRRELSPMAVPQPRAAAKPKNQPVYSVPEESDYIAPGQVEQSGTVPGVVMGNPDVLPGLPSLYQLPVPGQVPRGPQQGLAYSGYSVRAPVHDTSSGQRKPYQTDTNGVSFRQALVQGEDGKYHWRTNIDKPFVGTLGDAISLPVDKRTGEPITPADKAAYAAALRDPNNEARSFVQVIQPKNKNFTAEYTQRLKQLKAERARQQDGDILGKGKYNTDGELENQAREDATGETTISYVPNYGQDARTLDALTSDNPKSNYRAHREGLSAHQQGLRGNAPARPSFLKAKATATSAQATPTKPRRTGGMFN